MKKDQTYYGEVWFTDTPEKKQFCTLSFVKDDIILKTNLHSQKLTYKELQIFGLFTGLGHLTFVDCIIQHSSSGIIETRHYIPSYTFISTSHKIDPVNLKFKEFFIVNDTIVNWVNHAPWYDHIDDQLTRKQFNHDYEVTGKDIKINIEHYQKFHLSKRTEFVISNRGLIKFELKEPISVLSAIGLYNQFQKVLQLLLGYSLKFDRFNFKCLGCNELKELYYNEDKLANSTNATTFVHTKYEEIKPSLLEIFNAVYTDEKFQFCLDKLMENFIGKQPSHNKRFTNSIAAYEAFCKLYTDTPKSSLKNHIIKFEDVFKKVGKIDDKEWEKFPSKVVRSRDYHIHSNVGNKGIFSEFDLLYISFLFDFVIAYLLLSEINVQQELLDKYMQHGNKVFIDMKRTNSILGSNLLE